MKLWHFFALLFVGLLGTASFVGFSLVRDSHWQLWAIERFWSPPPAPGAPPKLVSIPPGMSASDIGDLLQDQGLVKDARAFRAVAARLGLSAKLQSGQYRLNGGMSLSEIASELQIGKVAQITVTVPEGKRTEEVLELVARSRIATVDQLRDATASVRSAYAFLRDVPASAGLEGYLFPDTYLVPPDLGPAAMLNQFLKNFDQKFTPDLQDAAARLGMSVHEALVMASIVEREAVRADERPRIAGVYYNRLREKMPLGADPTIQYAIAQDPKVQEQYGWWKRDLTEADLAVDSPYNTYRRVGLPPAPICNPGLASIKAAVNPEEHDFLFFVARQDGGHVFARTFEEHLANIAKYQP
ncbi:MAG: endolytic transglycosylase MltG [Chloroflexi bacterium]|nr:endolytic transglycosylase MltG [Chloroflexota bacterium]